MGKIHNVNLQPFMSVRAWGTKRVKAYKDRIQKHISYLETNNYHDEDSKEMDEINLQRFKNYKAELKKILAEREHVD